MGEPGLTRQYPNEEALTRAAADLAQRLRRAGIGALLIGLAGDLGTGKTTWARAMLRGLGHAGRVPSPTYTLVEHYTFDDLLVAHFDLYRLAGGDELENLGIRDWLAEPRAWLLVEWPERAPTIAAACDLLLTFELDGEAGRRMTARARTEAGAAALEALS